LGICMSLIRAVRSRLFFGAKDMHVLMSSEARGERRKKEEGKREKGKGRREKGEGRRMSIVVSFLLH